MIGAHRALAVTFYFLGDFKSARAHAMRGVQIWRSGGVQSPVEELHAPAVSCLCFQALSVWQSGETGFCDAIMAEAISLAKELHDMNALALALWHAGSLAHLERNPVEGERYSSDLIELSTRHHFAQWIATGAVLRGWAVSASGNTAEGISWIEDGIGDYRATGSILDMPFLLALKAEALHLADRSVEGLEAIREADALVERFENRYWSAELHRLRSVFLTAAGADTAQIEASFCDAIRIAKEQRSISLEKRAEATYAEYRRQKASGSGGRGFRLPLW
jgi:predicted ATPase